jgi:hypothetical protein
MRTTLAILMLLFVGEWLIALGVSSYHMQQLDSLRTWMLLTGVHQAGKNLCNIMQCKRVITNHAYYV